MTPLSLQLLLPVAVVAGAGIVLYRLSWREFPALISWMLWEVAFHIATFGDRAMPAWMVVVQDVVCAAVVFEVMRSSRINAALGAMVRWFVAILATVKILASLPDLTPIQEAYLFRSYSLWAAFLVLAWLTGVRLARPVLERKLAQVYRIGATCWIFTLAGSGSFVPGGIGYMLFPYTMRTWKTANVASYWAVMFAVLGMSLAMALTVKGRKRAAKRTDGRTATGLIERELAA